MSQDQQIQELQQQLQDEKANNEKLIAENKALTEKLEAKEKELENHENSEINNRIERVESFLTKQFGEY